MPNQSMADETMFNRGIENAVRTCMGVHAGDRVFVITDRATARIGEALGATATALGATAEVVNLETYAARPVLAVPERLRQDLYGFKPTVTFYAAQGMPGEVTFRLQFIGGATRELNVRHGHMIGIDERLILQGMQADYQAVARLTDAVTARASQTTEARVTSTAGTDLVARFSPDLRWKSSNGLYLEQGMWGNLPEGESSTCPLRLDGVLVGQVIGDYFSEKFGVLQAPVYVHVEDSRVRKVECAQANVADELLAYLRGNENGDRAGEFAIGTNTAVTQLTGNLLQDEKMPGIHVAFGNPYPRETGADWTSNVHVDIVSVGGDIALDGAPILRAGKFVGV
ncbi:MAG: aminopeptidase [Chloroflexota bacterium]